MDQPQIQTLLESVLGSTNVYFQPPTGGKMLYPAIVFNWDDEDTKFADNRSYRRTKRYQVTVMDRNSVSKIPDRLAELPLCSLERIFVADGLYHFVYNIYF